MSDPIVLEPREPISLPHGRVRLCAEVRVDAAEHFTAWIEIPTAAAAANDDWLVPIMVVRAMQVGRPVRIAGRVSPKLLEGAAVFQQKFSEINGRLRPGSVTADHVLASASSSAPAGGPARTASFFSGGLDSWYSALANEAAIDDLVFGAGIDLSADDRDRRSFIEPVVHRAIASLNRPLVSFETNLRECYRPWKNWSECFLGSALASCALAMSGRYTRFLIGGAHNERCQHLPWGTSAVLDPLWSSDSMQILHDGAISRVEKARRVATHETAMSTLRVCWRKDHGDTNCCRCEKCLRTMVALHLVGALDRCVTFNRPLDLGAVAAQRHQDWSTRSFMQENLDAAVAGNADPRLIAALRQSLERPDGPPAGATPAPPAKPRRSIAFKMRRESTRALRGLASLLRLR